MSEFGRIVGLVGPSGVGKGYSKEAIRRSLPDVFSEPVVVTTRPWRYSDGQDRLSGLSVDQFFDMVKQNKVLFAHQPFGENTHWYGFTASSFSGGKPILTEVHVRNIKLFREKFRDGLTLIALIADNEYLRSNMTQRGDKSEEIEKRLKTSINEVAMIQSFHKEGVVDHVVVVNLDNRDSLDDLIIDLVLKHIKC